MSSSQLSITPGPSRWWRTTGGECPGVTKVGLRFAVRIPIKRKPWWYWLDSFPSREKAYFAAGRARMMQKSGMELEEIRRRIRSLRCDERRYPPVRRAA